MKAESSRDERTLSHDEARSVYDRVAAFQSTQFFYEDPTNAELVSHGRFGEARSVFELGFGPGRFAARLFRHHLPAAARYRGIDLSPQMMRVATKRLVPFASRVSLELSDGRPPRQEPTGHYDRWISTFVLDLLSRDDIQAMLDEAHRMLRPGGLLAIAGVSFGVSAPARALARLWGGAQRLAPAMVGGCRPLRYDELLSPDRWRVVHDASPDPFWIPTQAVVAERIG